MKIQSELEDEMRTLGASRFRLASEKATLAETATSRPSVKRWMHRCHVNVVAGIEMFLADARSGKAGRKHSAVEVFERVDDIHLLAHLALRKLLDSVGTDHEELTRVGLRLGSLIDDELFFRHYRKQNRPAFKAVMRKVEDKTTESFKRRSARATISKMGTDYVTMSIKTKLLIGCKLIEIVMETTGLIEERIERTGKKTIHTIFPTPALLEWLSTEDARLEWLCPSYMPCVVEPKPWTSPTNGGYLTDAVRRLALVKSRDKAYLGQLSAMDLSQVYSAVNAIQSTAWSINTPVLMVMKALWDARTDNPVIPQAEDRPLPPRPAWMPEDKKVRIRKNDAFTSSQQAEFDDWVNLAKTTREANKRAIGRRVGFIKMLSVAEKFAPFDAIYFPHTLDFRGRVYPVPHYLTPQGNDEQRGLLQFAKAVPINDRAGEEWLAIHGAGLWGVDKVDFDARVKWVEENEDAIIAAASDPLSHKFWCNDAAMKEGKPWQALAFCFEWATFRAHGYGYESTLPVQMDGSCNGLQNFSAILRDHIGGAAVNLVPSDKPSDIYQQVADLVAARVRRDASSLDEVIAAHARGWVGRVTRKVCKRPVMTLAYGAKRFGMRQMVFDDTVTPLLTEKKEPFPFEGSGFLAAQYLGGVIWECVGQVVVAARSAMDWLQEAAKTCTAKEEPVVWKTPVGFMVKQRYVIEDFQQIDLTFNRVKIQLFPNVDVSEELDARRQANGVAPNWVHSLDAAHLMRTVNASHARGLRSYSMIHDSYGTHAGNAQSLSMVLREEFIRMYKETDVLADFAAALTEQLPEGAELLPLPKHGELDLDQVLESQFFFA